MTRQPPQNLAPALDALRRGDRAGARRAVETALAAEPGNAELLGFAGLLAAQAGDPAAAIPYFRRALAAAPADLATRGNLATALIATGALDEAGELCAGGGGDLKLLRIGAWIHQQQGRLDEAAAAYEKVVADLPEDFESWNNLGNVRAALEDAEGALKAFQKAINLRPDIIEIYLNASEALALVERHEARQILLREAATRAPGNARVAAELGLAEAATQNHQQAEAAFRKAIALDPLYLAAYLDLGLLLENLNRVDELAQLVEQAERHGMADSELDFIKAWSLRRQGRFAEAQMLAEAVPPTIHPVRRARLIADIADRLGQADRAFEAFAEMNERSMDIAPPQSGPSYREAVTRSAALLTREWVDSWSPVEVPSAPPAPIFIVGFPRSGTTLLDTLLMNMPNLHVLEEMPVMSQIDIELGMEQRLAQLTGREAAHFRGRYFEVLGELAPPKKPGQTIVDKHPLRMARMPVVARLFPNARVIMVERHPCDAVLSCFMANFQPNRAMRSFTTLDEAARTYDAVFEAWTRAEALLPIQVHHIRYERMVENLEGEMRPLLEFLGLPWDPKVLDNQAAAAERGHVRTASYSQVTEPIYKRAAGRWERYRKQLAPVLPILAPWAEKMGYGPLD
ncbi:MAG TPA: sulfotransferase [Allosphingosinicella sp.]|nr:sulfotransferase [Allosphingosinicella sp.]